MKYRRIDNETVQCIVSRTDMEEYGLTMTDLFERSERAEKFIRELLEQAHEEVGYEIKGNNIAIQITPIHDNGMIITLAEDNGNALKGLLEHMKDVVENVSNMDDAELAKFLAQISETTSDQTGTNVKANEASKQPVDIRIFEFDSISDVLDFAEDGFGSTQVKTYFGKADDKFYIVAIKNRMSWRNFDRLAIKAYEFGRPVPDVNSKLLYLSEHGEGLIENRAISRLAKIAASSYQKP